MRKATLLCFLTVLAREVWGHGMLMDPINRSSLWRLYPDFPINYSDNENFCGGFTVQWQQNGGKCGVCGDNYKDPVPRNNEQTGKYGGGFVARQYKSGDTINVTSLLTANHRGWFQYSICKLVDLSKPETEECFVPLPFEDGSYEYPIRPEYKLVQNRIVLPQELTCSRCVLRWHYKAGNNWGICENGAGDLGCGPQESFRSCADVAIL